MRKDSQELPINRQLRRRPLLDQIRPHRLVILGLLLARAFGWLWMDPLAGIIGACVIASWPYGLIRDTGAILLDMNPDRSMASKLRQAV